LDGSGPIDEDGDEIVREIDVYLSPALERQMYLVQFPLRHQGQPMSIPEEARIKTKHGILELEHSIPPSLLGGGRSMPDAIRIAQQKHVSHTIPVSTHMVLGKLESTVTVGDDVNVETKTALHLVPLSHITQMRPSFSHIDEAMMQTDDQMQKDADAAAEAEETTKNKKEKKSIMFQKKESERAALARQNSYAYKKSLEDAEEWLPLTVHDSDTPKAQEVRDAILCPSPHTILVDNTNTAPSTTTSSTTTTGPVGTGEQEGSVVTNGKSQNHKSPQEMYIQSLNYLPEAGDGVGASAGDDMQIEEGNLQHVTGKITKLLHLGWPVPYSVVRSHFSPTTVTDQDLIKALSCSAVMVRGNFVLQSHLTPYVNEPIIAQARTYILFLFQTLGYVQRFRLDRVYEGVSRMSSEILLMLLQEIGVKCENGWKFKLEDDVTFYQAFQEQAQMHTNYWERQKERYEPNMKLYNEATYDNKKKKTN